MPYEVVSKPGEETDGPKYEIVSRPKPDERKRRASFLEHYDRLRGESVDMMGGGVSRMTSPDSSLGGRALGAGEAALGGLSYLSSPLSAASRRVVGNPAEVIAEGVGASPEGQVATGDVAGIIGELLTAAGAAKYGPQAVKSAPGAIEAATAMAGPAAAKVGQYGRAAVNTIDDVIKNQLTQAGRRGVEKAANAPPSRAALKGESSALFKAADEAGVRVKPEAFGQAIDDLPTILRENKVISGDVPLSDDIYANTRGLLDRLENYRGHELTLDNLHILQREAADYVERAVKSADRGNQASDARASMIVSRQVDNFIENLNAEQVLAGQPEEAVKLFKDAKDLWRRQAKMGRIEQIVNLAERLNEPQIIQAEFHKIAQNPTLMRGYSEAEQALIDKIARRGPLDDIYEALPPISITRRGARQVTKYFNKNDDVRVAKKLMDTIAKGEKAQDAEAAAKAARTPVSERVRSLLDKNPNDVAAHYRQRTRKAARHGKKDD